MTARDLAEQMALLADLIGQPRNLPWPELVAKARQWIETREGEHDQAAPTTAP